MFGPFGSYNNYGSKKFRVKETFGSKKILGKKNFGSKKISGWVVVVLKATLVFCFGPKL